MDSSEIRQIVKEKYGQAASRVQTGGGGCCSAEDAREFPRGAGPDANSIAPAVDGTFARAFIRARKPVAGDVRAGGRIYLQVFDPAMCCSSGVCGPAVDPQLPRFAADLEWLASKGVAVERQHTLQETSLVSADTCTASLANRSA